MRAPARGGACVPGDRGRVPPRLGGCHPLPRVPPDGRREGGGPGGEDPGFQGLGFKVEGYKVSGFGGSIIFEARVVGKCSRRYRLRQQPSRVMCWRSRRMEYGCSYTGGRRHADICACDLHPLLFLRLACVRSGRAVVKAVAQSS